MSLTRRICLCFAVYQAVREAMEKHRATEILMEALCLSVPYDPAFVLEVHKDVLKTRLRCACVQPDKRDYVDIECRLASNATPFVGPSSLVSFTKWIRKLVEGLEWWCCKAFCLGPCAQHL